MTRRRLPPRPRFWVTWALTFALWNLTMTATSIYRDQPLGAVASALLVGMCLGLALTILDAYR